MVLSSSLFKNVVIAVFLVLSTGTLGAQTSKWLNRPMDFHLLETVSMETRNQYPVILVGGFLTFGRDEMFGYKYWGGFSDLQEELQKAGYTVFTSEIGPLSSNWDRACELYACIKGGRVDYGEYHSQNAGHKRFGKTYPGLYPEWGTKDPETGEIRKVHLLGHSMGGQTARLLVHLLNMGDGAELFTSLDSNNLFQGRQDWVSSVFTLSTPHNGTSLLRMPETVISLLGGFFALVNEFAKGNSDSPIDLKLDQWDLRRFSSESYLDYTERVWEEWRQKEDISIFDATPEGAGRLNAQIVTLPHVYYFSAATEKTNINRWTGHALPEIGMNPVLMPGAFIMGSHKGTEPPLDPKTLDTFSGLRVYDTPEYVEPVVIDEEWWTNDGVVNTISMAGPFLEAQDLIVPFDADSTGFVSGVWNYLGVISADHTDVIGIPLDVTGQFSPYRNLHRLYSLWLDLLSALPE